MLVDLYGRSVPDNSRHLETGQIASKVCAESSRKFIREFSSQIVRRDESTLKRKQREGSKTLPFSLL
jgi:hypothetical protein